MVLAIGLLGLMLGLFVGAAWATTKFFIKLQRGEPIAFDGKVYRARPDE